MRTAIVIEKFDPAAGGNERSTEQIARRLIARGHRVTILAAGGVADAVPEAACRFAGGMSTKTAIGLRRFARWARRQLRDGEFDVSLSMTLAVPADVIELRSGTVRETLARNLAMRPPGLRRIVKKLTVLTRPKTLALLAAERRTLNSPQVKRLVAISKYVADQLFHHYTIPMRRVTMIPNAAEARPHDGVDRERQREQTRQMLGCQPTDVVFVFAAMNPALKGLPSLLAATQQVRERHNHIKLIVAGPLRRAVDPALDALGDAVRSIGPTRQMDALYGAADVTVLPTWYDPSSKVVLESLLHGVPAISTLYNGASQWIFDPTGEREIPSPFGPHAAGEVLGDERSAGRVISSPADVAALADAMRQLCDPEVRQRCAAATHGLAARISMEAHVDALEALLNEIVGEGEGNDE